ncbi:hypothetical protein FQA39_LY13523 [Lamprigera yunnana]|nr:hypothetical protein FQA39_LY13523 [Lamprigera yunnana]
MTELETFIPKDESSITNGKTNYPNSLQIIHLKSWYIVLPKCSDKPAERNCMRMSQYKKPLFLLFSQQRQNGSPILDPMLQEKTTRLGILQRECRYEFQKGDPEAASALNGQFDPFKARVLEHPVTEMGTLVHLLKSCLGTGILSMPLAFKCSGLLVGIFAALIESLICTHCAYILVVCAHELYKRSGRTSMTFADVAEEACRRGPPWAKKYSGVARRMVDIGIFITYFGTCSAYSVIVAKNFDYVTGYYWGSLNIRLYLLLLLVPLIILCYVPNLKYLTPVSMIANGFMGVGIAITCYYLVIDLPQVTNDKLTADITLMPTFFSITIFALEAIGVIMPLENNMRRPQKFIGLCGVLNQGLAAVTVLYILVGFLGFLQFGDKTEANVTLNLPQSDIAAQIVQILIGLSVFCTFGLQFFVCLEIAWNGVKNHFQKHPTIANYVLRTIMVVVAVGIAIGVPTIGPFISLIGALCFSFLGLIIPILIEIVTFWEKGFGRYNWKIFKNVIVLVTGALALIFGTKSAVEDIIALYVPKVATNATDFLAMNDTLFKMENVTLPVGNQTGFF